MQITVRKLARDAKTNNKDKKMIWAAEETRVNASTFFLYVNFFTKRLPERNRRSRKNRS